MRRTFKICYRAFKAALQTKLEYRVDMALGMGAAIGFQLATLGMYSVLMNKHDTLAGWTGNELLLLLGLTTLTHGTCELFCNHIWLVPYYVVRGQLDRLMIMPVPTLPYLLVTAPELHCFGNLGAGAVLVAIAAHRLGLVGPELALLPLWILCGTTVYASLLVVCAAMSFWIMGSQNYHYLVIVSLLRGSAYPHGVFPRVMQIVLAWVLPLAVVNFIPGQALTGRIPLWQGLALPIGIAAILALLASLAWDAGLRRYESTGS
jgi:ABC-2 type transport system permease protein